MKQIFTLLMVLSLAIVGYGQTFKNTPLIAKRTADWCPNCGAWGWDFKTGILEEISAEDATLVVLHYSGNLANETAIAITDQLGGFGQPTFFLNNSTISASSSSWSNSLENLKSDVASMNLEIPTFGVELHGYFGASANEVVTEIALHVNEAVDGEYYIGTYLITNDLIHNQAGNSPTAEHKKLLLAEFTGTPFGREIGNGPIAEGVMDFSISTTFAAVPDGPTDVAVIIWEKTGNDYSIVNTAVVEGVELLSNNDDVNWVLDAKSFYAQDAININLTSENVIGDYRINVLSTNGQLVKTIKNSTANTDLNLQIDANGLSTGSYFLNVLTSNGVWSDKVMVVK